VPLGITLAIEPEAQRRFDEESARWSGTSEPARVALFRAVPTVLEERVRVDLVRLARPPFPVGVAGVLPLPTGVAYALASAELGERHRELQDAWWDELTLRDRRPLRPHVAVVRDLPAAEARSVYTVLRRAFRPYQVRAEGFVLWRAEQAWTELAHIPFAG
jgi:hypothetical protein